MKFPRIERIEDVLPHIEGKEEFIVAEREGYTVINYMVAFDNTFPPLSGVVDTPAILRECRGLMFDRDGKLISRPYNKFFNINEREETLASYFDVSQPTAFVIMDKLDGSFIRPVRIDGIIRLCTKMGVTEQAHQAEDFLEGLDEEKQQAYHEFFEAYVDHFTPIFEFCSRKNQVVIDYPEDSLVLTGMRHNLTGDYISYKHLKMICSVYKIPLVQAWNVRDIVPEPQPLCITRVVDAVRQWLGIEGVVLRYVDGRQIKIKALDYCEKHGAKDALLLEKNLLRFYLEGKLDDYLPLLDDQFRERVDTYIAKVQEGIDLSVFSAEETHRYIKKHFETRKEQALFINSEITPLYRGISFQMLDGKTAREVVLKKILDNTSTSNEVDSIRCMIGMAEWV